jgi:zinc protease
VVAIIRKKFVILSVSEESFCFKDPSTALRCARDDKKNPARFFLLLGLALMLITKPASALTTESFTLKNGMEVVVTQNHRVPAVSHMIWLRVGSADDPAGKSGLAHFHEHVMFLGTPRYSRGQYSDIIARHGGEQNAFTGYDATSYFVNIAKEHLPLVMELEADRIRGLTPSDQDIANERQVILEERRSRVENNPDALLNEQVNAMLFRNHPYRIPVIGWMHEMEGLTKQDVLDFHARYYHPNNMILIVSGAITADELRPLAEKYYGPLRRKEVPKREWTSEPPQIAARRITLAHPNVNQPVWSRTYSAASLAYGKKEHALPLFLLSQLLGGGKTSRLYQAIVVEQKLASSIDTSYSGFNVGPAQFEITAVPEKGVALDKLEAAIDAKIARLTQGIKDDELKRAKTLYKADTIYAREGLTSMARIMGWVRIAGLPADYFTLWPELIDQVRAEDILRAANETLQLKQSVTGALLPEAKP